jgi:hypothetical protein
MPPDVVVDAALAISTRSSATTQTDRFSGSSAHRARDIYATGDLKFLVTCKVINIMISRPRLHTTGLVAHPELMNRKLRETIRSECSADILLNELREF